MEYLLEAVLAELELQMDRLYWNKNQKDMQSPFQNTSTEYSNSTFVVKAYNWNEETDYNFKYKDLTVWWYKHFRRGLEWTYKGERNAAIPSEFLGKMLYDCIISVQIDWDVI